MANTIKNFPSQLEQDIDAAKKAVEYFKNMKSAHVAIGHLLDYQVKNAEDVLNDYQSKLKERNA